MRVYYLGVITTFLAMAGLAEAATGRGSYAGAIFWLVVGLAMVMTGYIK